MQTDLTRAHELARIYREWAAELSYRELLSFVFANKVPHERWMIVEDRRVTLRGEVVAWAVAKGMA